MVINEKPFTIKMYYENKWLNITARRIYESDNMERFEITGKRQNIVIRNNRPELRRQNKSNHKFKRKLHKGTKDIPEGFLLSLFGAMEEYIENTLERGNQARDDYNKRKNIIPNS